MPIRAFLIVGLMCNVILKIALIGLDRQPLTKFDAILNLIVSMAIIAFIAMYSKDVDE